MHSKKEGFDITIYGWGRFSHKKDFPFYLRVLTRGRTAEYSVRVWVACLHSKGRAKYFPFQRDTGVLNQERG